MSEQQPEQTLTPEQFADRAIQMRVEYLTLLGQIATLSDEELTEITVRAYAPTRDRKPDVPEYEAAHDVIRDMRHVFEQREPRAGVGYGKFLTASDKGRQLGRLSVEQAQ